MTPGFRLAAALLLTGFLSAPAFAQSDTSATYKSKCAPCHGADGQANTQVGKALKAASFKTPSIVKASDADLFAVVKSGKGKMPAWNGKLTDDEIKALVAFIRTLQK
jgi:mono/diheme cytochrome c family protein